MAEMNGAAGKSSREAGAGRFRQTSEGDVPTPQVCVRGRDAVGEEWVELTGLHDASDSGASLVLTRQTRLGQLLHLTFPPPEGFVRSPQAAAYDGQWSLVWAISPHTHRPGGDDTPLHKVSVMFVGNDLPRRFVTSAGRDFGFEFEEDGVLRVHERLSLVGAASSEDRRRKGSRLSIPVEVTLEVLGGGGSVTASEITVTENISRGGAAVWTALDIEPGTRLRMTGAITQASVIAVVRQRRTGADGVTRLHLEFVEGRWPLDGLR